MSEQNDKRRDEQQDRRSLLSSLLMAGGLTAGYGCFFAYAGKMFVSGHDPKKAWLYVTEAQRVPKGATINYTSPAGETVIITRMADTGSADDFVALSDVCPHLGCRVHWEQAQDRFVCPCHGGQFDRTGRPLAGPPKKGNQYLTRYPVKIEKGLLYIRVAVESLA